MCEGCEAVRRSSHVPTCSFAHPVLVQVFNYGSMVARWNLEYDEREDYFRDMAATYHAINRDEADRVYEECQSLGPVTQS